MTNVYEGAPDDRQSFDPSMSTSRFRPRYRALSDDEKALHDEIKAKAEELERLIDRVAAAPAANYATVARYKALALTSLEESIMWAVKALTT